MHDLQFKKIEVIESMAAGQMLDVVGIVESAGEHQTITLKNGRDAEKRSVVLRDYSNKSIEITLWGNYANDPGQEIQQASSLCLSIHNIALGCTRKHFGSMPGAGMSTCTLIMHTHFL